MFAAVGAAKAALELAKRWEALDNAVIQPKHYTSHPSGLECLDVTRHMNFNLGNAIKYIWRCDLKGKDIEDLKKAAFYINDEIVRRQNASKG